MSKYVPDISTHRWVIIAPSRTDRPKEKKSRSCVFDPGNEHDTMPEVFRIGEGSPDKPGWKVRVIPNKYPITDVHEVIIHSPDCKQDIEDLKPTEVQLIFKAYRQRFQEHRKKGQVLIFCNHGDHAGASIAHPHSQLVVIPSQINLDALVREPVQSIIADNDHFVVYCPDFSQWPYEVWIAPKVQKTFYGDIANEEIADLSTIVQRMIRRIKKLYDKRASFHEMGSFGYNYYIYPKENWYMRIIPRFVHRAGFELGTGLSVNVVDPIDAADELKKD